MWLKANVNSTLHNLQVDLVWQNKPPHVLSTQSSRMLTVANTFKLSFLSTDFDGHQLIALSQALSQEGRIYGLLTPPLTSF